MLNLETGRLFIGGGNILYPAMRKREFFETNFYKRLLKNEDQKKDVTLDRYEVKTQKVNGVDVDIVITFDSSNTFLNRVEVINSSGEENFISKLIKEMQDSSLYESEWGIVDLKEEKIDISFKNDKYVR